MFDQIVDLVKQYIGNDPKISSSIPKDKEDGVHKEIASHIKNGLANHASSQGGVGGLLNSLKNGVSSGSPVTSAIEGGLVSTLASKFGLSPMITGAIAGALPGILQKFANKATDPNDNSITTDSISKSLSDKAGSVLGGLFN